MSYHAEEAILDEIAASGPQTPSALARRVRVQCVPEALDASIEASMAIQSLALAGLIEADDCGYVYWDLTDYGWDVLTRLSHREPATR